MGPGELVSSSRLWSHVPRVHGRKRGTVPRGAGLSVPPVVLTPAPQARLVGCRPGWATQPCPGRCVREARVLSAAEAAAAKVSPKRAMLPGGRALFT